MYLFHLLGCLCLVLFLACGRIGIEDLAPLPHRQDTGAPDTVSDTETENDLEDAGFESLLLAECEDEYTDALFCSGFEDESDLQTDLRDGVVAADDGDAFSGERALRCAASGPLSFATGMKTFPPIERGTIYFRAYYYLPEDTLVGLIKLGALEGYDRDSEVDILNTDFYVRRGGVLGVYLHESLHRYESAPNQVPIGTWFCLVGSFEISATGGRVTLGIDDTPIHDVEGENTLPAGGISQCDFGIGWLDEDQLEAEIFVDNVVIHTEPVSCQ